MIFDVLGDGSYLALVDSARYNSFVSEEWSTNVRGLEPHFIAAMADNALLAWDTGFETDWRVEVSAGLSARTGFREVTGSIVCSTDELIIANYDSLSMAAQFPDHALPDAACENNRLALPSGLYRFRVVQLADPNDYDALVSQFDREEPNFLLEYETVSQLLPSWIEVPWSRL